MQNSTGAISIIRPGPDATRIGRAATGFTVLAISPDAEDHSSLAQLCAHQGWRFLSARTRRQASAIIRSNRVAVAICERDLPDGDWRAVLDQLERFSTAPLSIVASRLADDVLWADVLNMGGYDVLLKPFESTEVMWSVTSAYRQWASRPHAESLAGPPPPAA